MYVIETQRIGLRNWLDTDLPEFIEMGLDPRVMEFFPKLLTEAESTETARRLQNRIMEDGFGFWAAELKDTHEFIGFTGLSFPRFQASFTPCVEIGWRLAHNHWGKGYATEAAHACLAYGLNTLKFSRIVSFTSVLNIRSMQVMKKIGMHFTGEFDHPLIEEGNRLRRHVLYERTV